MNRDPRIEPMLHLWIGISAARPDWSAERCIIELLTTADAADPLRQPNVADAIAEQIERIAAAKIGTTATAWRHGMCYAAELARSFSTGSDS
jgi:hypothetical protein